MTTDPLLSQLNASSSTLFSPNAATDRNVFGVGTSRHGRQSRSSRSRRDSVDESSPLLTSTAKASATDFDEGDRSNQRRRCAFLCYATRTRCVLICLLLLILFVTVAFLITWFAIIPGIASSQLDQIDLKVDALRMQKLRDDGFHLEMNYTLDRLPSSFEAEAGVMNFMVFYNGTQLGKISLPSFKLAKGQKSVTMQVAQEFFITDESWWVAFVKDMLTLETFTWTLDGSLPLKIKGTPVGELSLSAVKFKKSITLPALNGMRDLQVTDVQLKDNLNWSDGVETDPKSTIQGIELRASCHFHNPSPVAISMGDILFALQYDPVDDNNNPLDPTRKFTMGLVVSEKTMLQTGFNELTLRGALINPDSMPELNLGRSPEEVRAAAGVFFSRFLAQQQLVLGLVGYGSKNVFLERKAWPDPRTGPQPPPISWLHASLVAVQNIVSYLPDPRKGKLIVEEVAMEKINMKIRAQNVRYQPVISGTIRAQLLVPFAVKMGIKFMKQSIDIYRCTGDGPTPCGLKPDFGSKALVGHVESNWDAAESRIISQSSSLESQLLKYSVLAAINNSTNRDDSVILDTGHDDVDTYQSFLKDVVMRSNVKMVVSGHCSARIATGFGEFVEVHDIPFVDEIQINGLDGFKTEDGNLLEVTRNLEVRGAKNRSISFGASGAYMQRLGKGQIGLELDSPLRFKLYYPVGTAKPDDLGVQVGLVEIPSLNLGDFGQCTDKLYFPLSNTNRTMNGIFCPVALQGMLTSPEDELDQEFCQDRASCPSRTFLSEYFHGNPKVNLQAYNGPPDLSQALDAITIRDVVLPGYSPAVFDSRRPPFPLVRRIIIKPEGSIRSRIFRLWCWLEFYNPFNVPMRYYYLNFDTLVGKAKIGRLLVNLTNYDPFLKKPVPPRPDSPPQNRPRKRHPEPSPACIEKGDCQIAPVDLVPSGFGGHACFNYYNSTTTLTRRMQVSIGLSLRGVTAFWRSLLQTNGTRLNVTIEGQVAVGIGAAPYSGPTRNDTSKAPLTPNRPGSGWRDPYLYPDDPVNEPVSIQWLDYRQDKAELWFRRMDDLDEIPTEPPYHPPDCDTIHS